MSSVRFVGVLMLLLSVLSGCAQTSELYAVRQDNAGSKPFQHNADDRPRVLFGAGHEAAKPSFVAFLNDQCGPESTIRPTNSDADKARIEGGKTDDKSTWQTRNHRANDCALRVAAYAVDQCGWMTERQNEAAVTAQVLIFAALATAAGATDVIALAESPSSNKTTEAALATAVVSNGAGIKGALPSTVQTKPSDMISSSLGYAEAVGISDWHDFASDPGRNRGVPTSAAYVDYARLHDALLGMCAANAIGVRKPRRVAP